MIKIVTAELFDSNIITAEHDFFEFPMVKELTNLKRIIKIAFLLIQVLKDEKDVDKQYLLSVITSLNQYREKNFINDLTFSNSYDLAMFKLLDYWHEIKPCECSNALPYLSRYLTTAISYLCVYLQNMTLLLYIFLLYHQHIEICPPPSMPKASPQPIMEIHLIMYLICFISAI